MSRDRIRNLLSAGILAMDLTFTRVGSLIANEQFQDANIEQVIKKNVNQRIDNEKGATIGKSGTVKEKVEEYVVKQGDSFPEYIKNFPGLEGNGLIIAKVNNIGIQDETYIGQHSLFLFKPYKDNYQVGTASWYGKDFHGYKTSSGELYNMYNYTAAHKNLPMGTKVRVVNLENGRDIIVKINDRGPFIKGRIIDLSYAAAESIGMVRSGVTKVKVEVLSVPEG